jgi:predicted metal-binding membrane protein
VSAPQLADSSKREELAHAFAAVRVRLGLVGLLLGLAALAWWLSIERMASMDSGPGTDLGTLGWFLGLWVVMMAAMMLPALSPTVALYSRMTQRRGPSRALVFAGAYLVIWAIAGLGAYALFEVGRGLFGQQLAWNAGGRWFVGFVLVVAALYELTPIKDVCLTKCRTPLGFLLGKWRDGHMGAFVMGSRHAGWCLGCCWALMAGLFALGVMSPIWMAFVAALVILEKTLPWKRPAVWGAAGLLIALAVFVVVAPDAVPGFVVPGGAHGMDAMQQMP